MDLFKGLKQTSPQAILLRYGISILGAVLATTGLVSPDDVAVITDQGAIIAGAIAAVAPVIFAVWQRIFNPTVPVKKLSEETQYQAAQDLALAKAKQKTKKPKTLAEMMGWGK